MPSNIVPAMVFQKKFTLIQTVLIVFNIAMLFLSNARTYADSKLDIQQTQNLKEARTQLQAIEDYLNSFRTLKARFRQINPDQTTSSGTLYLWRPGRMRLSYDQPNKQPGNNVNTDRSTLQRVIVANGDSFFDHNPEMDETTEIPVDATPASLIMREHIHFSDDIEVISHRLQQGLLAITLAKPNDADTGTLTLFFNPTPLALLEWEIIDAQQLRTRVILDAIETGIQLDASLFNTNF